MTARDGALVLLLTLIALARYSEGKSLASAQARRFGPPPGVLAHGALVHSKHHLFM